jgi:hypothetical protein
MVLVMTAEAQPSAIKVPEMNVEEETHAIF